MVALSKNIRSIDPNIDDLIANDIASAVNTLTIYTGEFLGPIIGGFLTSRFGFKYCCYLVFLIGAAFTVIFIGSFFMNIKNEIETFIKSKDDELSLIRMNRHLEKDLLIIK